MSAVVFLFFIIFMASCVLNLKGNVEQDARFDGDAADMQEIDDEIDPRIDEDVEVGPDVEEIKDADGEPDLPADLSEYVAAPTYLVATDTPYDEGGSIDLVWTPSVTRDVIEQRIYRGTRSGGGYIVADVISDSTTRSYTDMGLENGTEYFYVLTAYNGSYESPKSNEASAIPRWWWHADWDIRRKITVNHENVAEDVAHFPMLVYLDSDRDLAGYARDDGWDIAFTESDGVTKLDHEIDEFDGETGRLAAWVNVTGLSSSADTDIYMYYDNPGAENQENAAAVWRSVYRGVWHMKEDPSGMVRAVLDSTSHGNNATSVGTMASGDRVDGKIGTGLRFDGVNNRVVIQDSPSLRVQSFTISGWFYKNTSSGIRVVFAKQYGTSNRNSYEVWNSHDENYMFAAMFAGAQVNESSGTRMPEGDWAYFAVTCDSSQVVMTMNGSLEHSFSRMGTIDYDSAPVVVGADDEGIDNYRYFFYGVIDEFRILNTPRTPGWIRTEYANQSDPSSFYTVGDPDRP